jgi:tetratricopeptide (TPR) repeat protein
VRHPPEVWLIAALSAFALTGVVAMRMDREPDLVVPTVPVVVEPVPTDAAAWFLGMRPFCNPVDVESRMRISPAPATAEGAMHEAACYALAGRIDDARARIMRVAQDQRFRAAGVVFEAGHPAADAGDDVAAGPLMELVVEFWPNHYMALYHAGAARYELGDFDAAEGYLERFLVEYATEDGWRGSARGAESGQPVRAHAQPAPHPTFCDAVPLEGAAGGTGALSRRSTGESAGVTPTARPARPATSPQVASRSSMP